jgi:hypothetical protein
MFLRDFWPTFLVDFWVKRTKRLAAKLGIGVD